MAPEVSAESIAALHAPLRRAAETLRAMPITQRATLLAAAALRLFDETRAPGQKLRDALAHSTGLSRPVLEHGLRTTLGLFTARDLLALHEGQGALPETALAVVILAGNVFSAAARPLLLPLLCGSAVLAKASSADDVLPCHLQKTLAELDPRVGNALAVVTFARGEPVREAALVQGAELVSVYGSDETVAEIAARLLPSTRLLAHGHGLGAMFVAAEALRDAAAARELAARAALDVAAYDQRGCLSPHAMFVQTGGAVCPSAFAALLAEALETLATSFPRGPLPIEAAAEQLQWRGVASALGTLHRGSDSAVSYEQDGPLRVSPGYRNISVYACADVIALRGRLAPLRAHLKALGIAGTLARQQLADLAPYTCEVGAMQTPPLAASLDGLHPLAGLG